MKKLLFVLSICGLVFTSCGNASKKKSAKQEETHQHEGCSHDHDGHSHNHGDASHDHNTQEEFVVEENASTKKCCSETKEGECKEEKQCDHDHEGHDHDHNHEGHSH